MDKYNSSDFFKMAGIKASIDIETYERDMKEKDKELERYKNIIDELEKAYYKMEEKQVEIDGRGYYYTDLIPIEEIIDKLKELKGE